MKVWISENLIENTNVLCYSIIGIWYKKKLEVCGWVYRIAGMSKTDT
jgi:hypothetical protein